jgi:4'-phosphopantetheinyl transferase
MPESLPAGWLTAPARFTLAPGEAVVWRLAFARRAEERAMAAALLSSDEQARAARLVRPVDRDAFVLQRATLRLLLQRLVGRPAAQLRFTLGPRGKPALAGLPHPPEFNVSGSAEWGLLAFAADFPVGVDVEAHRRVDHLELAARVFAPAEQAELVALPAPDRTAGFFAGWSRKEAVIKALGEGIYFPLESFAVALAPGAPVRVNSFPGGAREAEAWTLQNLTVADGYSAALAARATISGVKAYDVPDLRQLALS